MRLLVTGGAGFIGSNFVHYALQKGYDVVVLDKLTYAGNLNNLKDIMDRIHFVQGDICDKETVEEWARECEVIVNFAAETHVDRSIVDAEAFVRTDVFGTYRLLEATKDFHLKRFVHISTDEVYGSIEGGSFKETDPLRPSSPYSASKAAADMLTYSYYVTYGLPTVTLRPTNNFGPYHYPEKLIPLFVTNALLSKELPLYGDGQNVRDWLYVLDNCRAIELVLQKGKEGEAYNVGGGNERTNLGVTKLILRELGKPESLITFVRDRPGHDRRYSVDCSKIRELGWEPTRDFETALKETVKWYKENPWWWEPLRTDSGG